MRWKLGPQLAKVTRKRTAPPAAAPEPAPAPPAAPAKPDVEVTIKGYDEATETVTITIPAYDPAAFNPLSKLRVYAVPAGHGLPIGDGDAWVDSSYPFTEVDVAGHTEGVDVGIELPAIPDDVPADIVDFLGQTILGFDA